jgi:putative ATP-binding cassette transporter
VSAGLSAGFLSVIHRALETHGRVAGLVLAFVGFGVGRVLVAFVVANVLGHHAQEALMELRRKLIGRALEVPYRQVERVGSARLHAALTHDVSTLEAALESLPGALANAAIVVGAAVYLAVLSPTTLALLALLALPSLLAFRLMAQRARRAIALHRAEQQALLEHLLALSEGLKQLKLHVQRRESFLREGVLETTEAMLQHEASSRTRYALAQGANQLIVVAVLGALLFALPSPAGAATGFVLAAVYLLGPLASISQLLPTLHAAEIALAQIEAVGIQLEGSLREPQADPSARSNARSIELQRACYRYDDARAFQLGPLSLTIKRGELTFIAGGNGSGKSTLARLLTGLYAPVEGALVCDGVEIGDADRDGYRQLWSAVFSEQHLFDRLYGLDAPAIDARAQKLLPRLGLEGVVRIDAGRWSTLQLSRGQQKRVALLVALLEDRPFYLFDEWAAEQDPDFRRIFYREVLPELRQHGKGVVVITHDDRYFDAADRLLVLREGRLTDGDDA